MRPSEEELAALEKKLYAAATCHEWHYRGPLISPLKRLQYSVFTGWFIPLIFIIGFNIFTIGDEGSIMALYTINALFIGSGIFLTLYVRYTLFADRHIHYQLNEYGVHYTNQEMVPEGVFAVVRGLAVVGIVVSIIAVFFIGPLALAGAGGGGFALFYFTEYKATGPYG